MSEINNKIYYETLFAKIGSYDSSGINNNINLSDLRSIEDTESGEPLIIGYHQIIYGRTKITTYISAATNDHEYLWYVERDSIFQLKINTDSLTLINTFKNPVPGKLRHIVNIDSCHYLLYNDLNTYHYNKCDSEIELLPIQARINKMVKGENDSVWIATNGEGIVIFSINHQLSKITKKDGLDDSFIDQIIIGRNNIWVLHRKGVDLIKPLPIQGDFTIQHLWDLSGSVRSISSTPTGILATTSTGIYQVDENYNSPNAKSPTVFIDWYSIDGIKQNYDSNKIQLSPSTNQIQFRFSSPVTNIGEFAYFRYRIKNQSQDNDWIDISDRILTFANLQAGNVDIEIQTRANNTDWSESTVVEFELKAYWYEQPWIKWLTAFLSSLILLAIIQRARISIQHRKRLQSEKLFAELSARKAQFKSHFVFNSINSVRNYLLHNDKSQSDNYLVTYSKLMRKMLDVSNKVLIPLSEELELIEFYLSLEQMRLRNQFEYQIEVSPDIKTNDLKCPATITQVFVENAIWHGIMPMNDTAYINIFISRQTNNYTIMITDDGVGFDESDITQKDQTSWGMSIVRDKTQLIKETYNVDIEISIQSKKGLGTSVSITLPIRF